MALLSDLLNLNLSECTKKIIAEYICLVNGKSTARNESSACQHTLLYYDNVIIFLKEILATLTADR
ncbi:hypothetical protein SLEP1_g59658 [Rubroshorea leprosula]|uniref:Uncharacterized protein n=1 Tax=Rubroshorea leprosula TaxID=152421 RepID=A0AAV5MX23_9ROSI|nr:hypothetical protein SLEP1_g59658 [Rubroshorea leprosula]